jgi:ABC-2 type transport system ATP-binding protein
MHWQSRSCRRSGSISVLIELRELRRFRASRLFWFQALGFFGFFLLLTWVQGTTIHFSTRNNDGFIAGTSAQGLLLTLPTVLLLLVLLLPFVTADGVTRDLYRRTHELLLATALPGWAYVWGRYLVGLLGLVRPNGAGKTSLMRMIATLLEPTEGRILWNGQDIRTHGQALRQVLGYLPQDFGIYPEFTGRQFLRYLAAMKGLPRSLVNRRVDEVLEVVNLEAEADRKLPTYSGGMKQRIGIAQALLNDPELLIVDEPTAGLDPAERVRFRTLLASLTRNRIVLLSTHIISDVEAVASCLVILQQGRVLADTTPEELLAKTRGAVWSVTVDQATALQLQANYQVSTMVTQMSGITLRLVSATRPHETAVVVEPNLEEAYLLATGGQAVRT